MTFKELPRANFAQFDEFREVNTSSSKSLASHFPTGLKSGSINEKSKCLNSIPYKPNEVHLNLVTKECIHSAQDRQHSPTNSEPDWNGSEILENSDSNSYDESLVYHRVCKLLGIVPVSSFLHNLSLSTINLKHHGLGPKGAKAICVCLSSNSYVTSLNLCDNGLGPSGAIAVADMLKENCFINEIDISLNKLGNPGAIVICQVLLENSTVTRCNLSRNEMENKCAEHIADLFRSNFSLTLINLSHNKLGENAGILIGNALAENEVLKVLDLSWNSLVGAGAIAISLALKNNSILRSLDLSFNGISGQAVLTLGDSLLHNSTLTHIYLSNNNIFLDSISTICRSLELNDSLQYFDLSCNPLESDGAIKILNSIKKSENCSLQLLNLKEIAVNSFMAQLISDVRVLHPSLKILHGDFSLDCRPIKSTILPIIKFRNFLYSQGIDINDLFKKFDEINTGYIQTKELHKALKNMSLPLTNREISDLIKSMDKTLCGTIEYQRYLENLEP